MGRSKGFKNSEETKLKMSEAHKGHPTSNETKIKIGLTSTGRKHPEETRKSRSGENHWNWKGGKQIQCGYIRIHIPTHPNCTTRGFMREHRLVMEEFLGRYLLPYETVHHINGIRTDNRIENLELLPSRGEHNLKVQKVYQENLQLKQRILELESQLLTA